MVHPSQVEALCWRLHGMGGDSSSALIPRMMRVLRVLPILRMMVQCVWTERSVYPFILCVQFTLGVSLIMFVTHFIRVPCMLRVPLLLHVPLMMIVTHFICVSCMLYVPHAALATHLTCAPYATCSTYALFTLYGVCALYTFFQLMMIWRFKSDFSLLLVLVVSLFPYTQYCAFMLLRTNTSNCFQNDAFAGKK